MDQGEVPRVVDRGQELERRMEPSEPIAQRKRVRMGVDPRRIPGFGEDR